MKILVCTMFSPSYQPIADITLPILKSYCEKHGYGLNVIVCPDWNYNYVKHEWLKDKMKEDVDVFFYIDADAIITNPSITIESLLEDGRDFYIAEDVTEVNGGVFILRNTEWGHFFNNSILEEKDNFVNEQNVYDHYKNHPNFKNKIKILPQSAINAYDYSLYPELQDRVGRPDLGDWQSDNFIFHVPALTIPQRIEALKKHIQ